jgi:hypothetical protein
LIPEVDPAGGRVLQEVTTPAVLVLENNSFEPDYPPTGGICYSAVKSAGPRISRQSEFVGTQILHMIIRRYDDVVGKWLYGIAAPESGNPVR